MCVYLKTPRVLIDELLATASAADIERVLELKFGTLSKWRKQNRAPADGLALLRILNAFPWLINVAEDRFRDTDAKAHLVRAGAEALIADMKEQDDLRSELHRRM